MLFECDFFKGGDNFVCNNVIRTINSLFLCQTLLRPAAMLIMPLSTLPSPVHHYPGHSLCWIHSYTIANLNMDKCVCVCVCSNYAWELRASIFQSEKSVFFKHYLFPISLLFPLECSPDVCWNFLFSLSISFFLILSISSFCATFKMVFTNPPSNSLILSAI